MKKVSVILSKIILVLSGLSLIAVLFAGMMKPPHNLLSSQMLPATAVLFSLLFCACLFLPSNFIKETDRNSRFFCIAFCILLALFTSLLFFLNIKNPLREDSLTDYSVILANAKNMALGKPLETPLYFRIALNNFKPVVILSLFYRIAYLFRLPGPELLLLSFFTLSTSLSVFAACMLLEGKNIWRYRILLLLLFLFMLPIYVQNGVFYTDNMTFGSAVLSIYLIKNALKKKSPILFSAFSGILLALGFAIKVTVAIPIFAAAILLVLYFLSEYKEAKSHLKHALLFVCIPLVIAFSITAAALEIYCNTFEDYRISKKTTEPVISYVALGLTGNGSFADNSEFGYKERYLDTKEEKAEYSKQYIRENLGQFMNPSHVIDKSVYNFSGGFLGANDFVHYPLSDFNLFYELFDAWGKYYWRTSQYCFLYAALLYLTLFTGCILGIFGMLKKEKFPFGLLLGNLTFFGLYLFLMLWEANNRQLYNQMPLLCFSAVCIIRQIRNLQVINPKKNA